MLLDGLLFARDQQYVRARRRERLADDDDDASVIRTSPFFSRRISQSIDARRQTTTTTVTRIAGTSRDTHQPRRREWRVVVAQRAMGSRAHRQKVQVRARIARCIDDSETSLNERETNKRNRG